MPRMLRRAAVLGATAHVASGRGAAKAQAAQQQRPPLKCPSSGPRCPSRRYRAAKPARRGGRCPDGRVRRPDEAQGATRRGALTQAEFDAQKQKILGLLTVRSAHCMYRTCASARHRRFSMAIGPVPAARGEFRQAQLHGEIVEEFRRLRENDVIRLIDALVVQKHEDGSLTAVQWSDLSITRPKGGRDGRGAHRGRPGR